MSNAIGMMLIRGSDIQCTALQAGLTTQEKLQVGARAAQRVTWHGDVYHAYWPYQRVIAPCVLPEGVAYEPGSFGSLLTRIS